MVFSNIKVRVKRAGPSGLGDWDMVPSGQNSFCSQSDERQPIILR